MEALNDLEEDEVRLFDLVKTEEFDSLRKESGREEFSIDQMRERDRYYLYTNLLIHFANSYRHATSDDGTVIFVPKPTSVFEIEWAGIRHWFRLRFIIGHGNTERERWYSQGDVKNR